MADGVQRHGLRPRVKFIIGRAPVMQTWADEIGADGYGKGALVAVVLAKKLVNK
ncbi:MAG: hypothetical protein WBR26_24355 [Candidatus Acidiferrum sp.]